MESKVAVSFLALCALLIIKPAQGGFGLGACPERSVMSSIDLTKYAGRWYENSSFGAFFEFNGKCVQAVYTPQSDGSIEVINSLVDKTTLKIRGIKGNAVPEDKSGDGKLLVTFPVGYFGWILTRKPTLDEKFRDKIDSILTANKLQPSQYKATEQDCGAIDCSQDPCKIIPSSSN